MDSEKIGKFIAKLRKEKKMTQEDLANHLYTDRTTISKWERGKYVPKYDIILKLCKLFDVSVNEIYYGERENKKNKDEVNEVTINILKESKRKIKTIILISVLVFMFMMLAFFTYYFISNYKSISVYTISGNENDISVNGIMVISNEKMYIQLGDIPNINESNIDLITLYYKKDNNKRIIFSDNYKPTLYINKFGDDEEIPYGDIKYVRENLYLEIKYVNNTKIETIKLSLKRDFTNSNLLYKKNKLSSEEKIKKIDYKIPKYIKENFDFDEAEECYYLTSENKNFKVTEKYYYNAALYVVEEKYKDYCKHFEYINSTDISYYEVDSENLNKHKSEFSYGIMENKCLIGNCDNEKITYFINNYIDKIGFRK